MKTTSFALIVCMTVAACDSYYVVRGTVFEGRANDPQLLTSVVSDSVRQLSGVSVSNWNILDEPTLAPVLTDVKSTDQRGSFEFVQIARPGSYRGRLFATRSGYSADSVEYKIHTGDTISVVLKLRKP